MSFRHLSRGGEYFRVADPDWDDPLDGSYSRKRGGRWNAPGSFSVVYLSRSVALARAFVLSRFKDEPIEPEDLNPAAAPVLVTTEVPTANYVDVVTDAGCRAASLPPSYPLDEGGNRVLYERCQPIGQKAWDDAEPGIACRSAVLDAPQGAEELAWFARRKRLRSSRELPFEQWFWTRELAGGNS